MSAGRSDGRLGAGAARLRALAARYPALSAAFAVSVGLTAFFLVKVTLLHLLWSGSGAPEPPLEGWMTPRYVARAWEVPPEVITEALGLEADAARPRITLAELARRQGRSVEAVIADVEAAVAAFRGGGDG